MTPSAASVATQTARPRSFHVLVQSIASAAFLRGVVLMRGDTIVGSVEARDLCRLLRTAHEATRGDGHAHRHVERLAHGITLRLGVKGAVQVSRSAMNLIEGYAKRQKRASSPSLPARHPPPHALARGEVPRIRVKRGSRSERAAGGVKGHITGAHDPSVGEDPSASLRAGADTSPPTASGRRA